MCVLAVHADTLFSLGINIFLNTCIIIMPSFYDKSVEWYVGLLAFEVCKAYVPALCMYLFKTGAMSMHLIYGGFVRGTGSRLYLLYTNEICSRWQQTWLTEPNSWRKKKKTVRFLFAAKKQEKPNASKRLSRAHGVESARHGRRRAHLWSFSLWQADEKSKACTRGEGKSAASGPSAAAESPVPIGFWGRWCRGGEARSAPQLTSKVKLPKAGHHDFTVWLEFGTANFWLGCLKGC